MSTTLPTMGARTAHPTLTSARTPPRRSSPSTSAGPSPMKASFYKITQEHNVEDVQLREIPVIRHESRRVVGQRRGDVQRVGGPEVVLRPELCHALGHVARHID